MNLIHQSVATKTGWSDLYTAALKERCMNSFALDDTTYQQVKFDTLFVLGGARPYSPEPHDMLLQCMSSSESGQAQLSESVDANMEHIVNLIKSWGLTG